MEREPRPRRRWLCDRIREELSGKAVELIAAAWLAAGWRLMAYELERFGLSLVRLSALGASVGVGLSGFEGHHICA